MTRVLLLTDRPLFARTLTRLVSAADGNATLEHRPLAQRVANPDENTFDRVIVDLGTADADAAHQTMARIVHTVDGASYAVLDTLDEDVVEAALDAGATGVIVKEGAPQALVAAVACVLAGDRCRPPPSRTLPRDALPEALRAQLNGREQKLLRLALAGTPVVKIARELGMTEAKVVSESRRLNALVRGRAL